MKVRFSDLTLNMPALLLGTACVFATFIQTVVAEPACEVQIDSNDMMQFDKSELTVPASCESVTLTLTHSGKLPAAAMGHNWVLSEYSEMQAISSAGIAAGLENNYLPVDDARVFAATKIIGGGESDVVTFSIADLKGKDLGYFCSFPGHVGIMKGKFIIE